MRRALPAVALGAGALVWGLTGLVRGRRLAHRLGAPGPGRLRWLSNEQYAQLVALRRRRRGHRALVLGGAAVLAVAAGWLLGRRAG